MSGRRRRAGNYVSQSRLVTCFSWRGNVCFIGEKKVGWLAEDDSKHIYVSPRNRTEHFFRIYNGWGITQNLLLDLKARGVQEIWLLVTDGNSRRFLKTGIDNYFQHGINHKNESSPYELQLVLEEIYFEEAR